MSLTNVGARLGLYVFDLVKLGEAVGSCVGLALAPSAGLEEVAFIEETIKKSLNV